MKYKRAYIEITNVCNLHCSFCPETKRVPCLMPLDLFQKAALEAASIAGEIYLHLMGEPLLHPDLRQMLTFCGQEKIPVKLTTNGTLLKNADCLLEQANALRQINISMHCFFANQMTVSYEEYCADIFDFAKRLREKNENCVIMLRLWNESSKGHVDRDSRGDADVYALGHVDRDSRRDTGGYTLGYADASAALQNRLTQRIIQDRFGVDITAPTDQPNGCRLGHRFWVQTAERFDWPSETALFFSEDGFCFGLRTHFGILADGTVVPCCLDNEGTLVLGNITTQPLQEILKSPQAKQIYNGFSENKAIEPLCRHCGYRKRFNANLS